MPSRIGFLGLVCIAAASITGSAHADPAPATCFAQHVPVRALPYHVDRWVGQSSYSALAGARIFFWAEPGLTREWLHYQMARRLGERRTTGSCPLDVPGVRVRVLSAGPGFWLDISSDETRGAQEVLRRATALVSE